MRKIVIIIIFHFLCLYCSFGQYSSCDPVVLNDIYTPLGSFVGALAYNCEYDAATRLALDNEYAKNYPNAIRHHFKY